MPKSTKPLLAKFPKIHRGLAQKSTGPSIQENYITLLSICWTRHDDDIATVDTGSIKEVPDQFVVLKGAHNVEHLRATRTDVDRAKGP